MYLKGAAEGLENVALSMRDTINNSQQTSDEVPWPPSVESMDRMDSIPDELRQFLSLLLNGKNHTQSQKQERLLNSIGQDICRVATNGDWKFPKHILLCITIRHLFRSKELTTLMNRLGHCESYSFALELETAIATASQQSSSLLCEQISRQPIGPSVFHSEFDNFDQFVNNLSGQGSVHTAHGIMLQDCIYDQPEKSYELPVIQRTKLRSWDDVQQVISMSATSVKDAHP